MNRSSLAKEISRKLKVSQRQAENLVIAFGAVVTDALEKGEKVIYSNFGSFYIVEYPSKTITHPQNGKKLVMLPTRVAKFMPSDTLKKMVNNGADLTQLEALEDELGLDSAQIIPIEVKSKKLSGDPADNDLPKNQDVVEEDNKIEIKTSKESLPKNKEKPAQSGSGGLLTQAHLDDDIERYHQHKEALNQPSNVYEEILSDGSSEISTVQGAIRLHHDGNEDKKIKDAPANKEEKLQDEESLSPLDILKRKLGIKKIDSPGKGSLTDSSSSSNHDGQELADQIDKATKPKVNLAGSGIFDKVPIAISKPPLSPAEPASDKIEEIKQEIGETPSPVAPQESGKEQNENDDNANNAKTNDQPEDTPEAETKSGPIFTGIEGAFSFDKAKIEYKDLSKIIVPKELLSKIPENIARSYKAVAFEQNEDIVSVAMVDPEDIETREMLKRICGRNVRFFLATESDINSVLNQYQGLETEVSSAIASAEEEDLEEEAKNKSITADTVSDDAPAAKIVSSLLKRAIRDKASDIHIEPTEKEVEVRFRLDGVLRKKVSLPKDIQAAVTSRIKILSNLKIDEQRVPQDGRFNMHVDNRRVDFRVSSMPVAFGEKIVMRILDKDSGILSIEELGITGSGLKSLDDNLSKSHGMVLVTGPTGSGKSTTLYAMIQKVYNEGVNIITLEDPIEYQMRGINQSQVNSDIGYTFAAGLRSILRQDPDIIMLGEIRDKETAEMAVHAALTGHVVLSTLHTNDAAGAAPRMIDMGVEPFLLTSSINVIVGQRLVRKICPECREEVKLPEEELAAINQEIEKMPQAEREATKKKALKFYKGKGCKSCDNSGYKGRIGIYEVLDITPEMQQLILKRVSSEELNNQAIKQGMVTMIQDGILKATEGVTSMEEVWRATKN